MTRETEKVISVCSECWRIVYNNLTSCYKVIKFADKHKNMLCSFCRIKKCLKVK